MRVRIEDVARQAGVSPTAVSFAFNNPHRLSPHTVTRILDVARQLGYAPNPHARALLAKSLGVIGVITPQSLPAIYANPFFPSLFEGIAQVCEENCLSLLTISPVMGSLSAASAKAPVDGLIVVGLNEDHPEVQRLMQMGVPFVIVDGDAHSVPSINVDDEEGAFLSADYLLSKGLRDITILIFETDHNPSHGTIYGVGERRLQGLKRAFKKHKSPWDDSRMISTIANVSAAAATFTDLWKSGHHPEAVLTVADVMAIGVLQAATELGIRIPEELAVIGFDDIPQASWTQPPLTTIRQPVHEKGEMAAQLLVSLISGETPESIQTLLATELVIRQSV